MQTKYIPQENANRLMQLLRKAQELCPNVKFKVVIDDGEVEYEGWSKSLTIDAIDGLDCDIGINCYDGDKHLGWFGITPYEEPDCVICDYSDNEFCETCWKASLEGDDNE